jgi:hypothetical protein
MREEQIGLEIARQEAQVQDAVVGVILALKGDGTQNLSAGERLAVAGYLVHLAQAVLEHGSYACWAAQQVDLPPLFQEQIRQAGRAGGKAAIDPASERPRAALARGERERTRR